MVSTKFDVWTIPQASGATGTSNRTAYYWTSELGLITPANDPGSRGAAKELSTENVVQLGVLKILGDRGLGLECARNLMQVARREWWAPSAQKSERLVLVNGTRWVLCSEEDEREVMKKVGEVLIASHDGLVINLTAVKRMVQAA